MDVWNKDRVVDLLLAAGTIAMRHYETPRREVKDDGSLVTQADHEIEAFFRQHFDKPKAGCYLVGEETVAQRDASYVQEALANCMYVVDPIDGTACYAHHVPVWGISVGFARAGVLEEGAIYLPVTGELFISQGDSVYWTANARAEAITWEEITDEPQAFRESGLVAITQKMGKKGSIALSNPIHALACAVVPLAYLLLHRYTAYLGHLKLWDLAGGLPLLLKAGYTATLQDGTPLDGRVHPDFYHLSSGSRRQWKLRQPCLFAAPGVAAQILPHFTLPDTAPVPTSQ